MENKKFNLLKALQDKADECEKLYITSGKYGNKYADEKHGILKAIKLVKELI